MFGFKLIKEEEYSVLKYQLERSQELLSAAESNIKSLTSKNKELERQVKDLLSRVSDSSTPDAEPEAILLTDVAAQPLKEEKKPAKKPRKTVKNTDTAKPRKKVVRKAEEI